MGHVKKSRRTQILMKKPLFLICLLYCNLAAITQISIPYENFWTIADFPKSNSAISFKLPNPFVNFKDSIPASKTTYQYIVSVSPVSDSLLSSCIKFAMFSLNYKKSYCSIKNGTEIWYGVSKGNIPTFASIYYKTISDSVKLYVLTAFSLTYFDKKTKTDLSKLICKRIMIILDKQQKKKIF
jgi:hypothetical protein